VITALDPIYQTEAEKALRKGIRDYDLKRGFRGKIGSVSPTNWQAELNQIKAPAGLLEYELSVVLETSEKEAKIGLSDGSMGKISLSDAAWARTNLKSMRNILSSGDVVVVQRLQEAKSSDTAEKVNKATEKYNYPRFALKQIPDVNGAIEVILPATGEVLALCGGYDFNVSKFDRATQALRQPGSLSKSFVYLAALESGIMPNRIFQDGPIEISQGAGMPPWRPKNYKGNFLGDITMRSALEKSRNLVTVRIAQLIGLSKVTEVIKRFGINHEPKKVYSMVLGSIETTLNNMTAAYASIANGGHKVTPKLIELIKDRNGKIIYKRDMRDNRAYKISEEQDPTTASPPMISPRIDTQPITDERSAYQITSMLTGSVERGTSQGAKKLKKVIAGKTGTTNDSLDTWFIGFTPIVTVGTYIGFDTPKSLGKSATGATVALPIFVEFMEKAYKFPSIDFRVPEGIKLTTIDPITGRLSLDRGILEAFKIRPSFTDGVTKPDEAEGSEDSYIRPGSKVNDIFEKLTEPVASDPTEEIY
jgi:penicillin-binding protein 1A